MKISKQNNLFVSCLIAILSIGISIDGYSQCGTEPITVHPWCENTYAQWDFTSPTANAQYNWYNYAAGPYTYDANGKLIKTGATSISPIDSTTANTYYSPFRVTTAGISPSTTIDFTYQKKVSYSNINPYPATAPTFSTGATGSTFTMDFTTTLTNAVGLRFNSVTVPVVLNTPGKQYKIQVSFGTSAGPGSAIYTFSSVSAQSIGGNNYLITIPINYTLTASGAQKLVINTNPTGGTGSAVDGLLYASTQAPAFSAAGNPISIPAASAVAGPSGGFSQIYNWNYSVVCTPQSVGPSAKTTTGCCIIPGSVGLLSLNADKSSIVNGGAVNVNFTVGSGTATNYFGWYLNGVLVPAASGIGKMTYSSNLVGTWEVREVKNSSDLNNPSCTVNASVVVQDKKIFLTNVTSPSHSPLCIGDQWTFTGAGSSSLTWSSGKGTLAPTTGLSTTYTATAVGTDVITLSGNVPSGDLIGDGSFESYVPGQSIGANSQYGSNAGNPANSNFVYTFNTSSLNGGSWGNSDWTYNNSRTGAFGNPGKFMIINGATNDPRTLVWSRYLNSVQPGKTYNFSFDLTSVSYYISNDPAMSGYPAGGPSPSYTYRDVLLDVYVNGVKIGQASTNFAANGGLSAVGKWTTNSFPWTAGASTTTAALELRLASPFVSDDRGYDFGLDNITFGGTVTQTDTYAIGNVTDCSTLTAAASACVNDTYSNLTATLTGGLVFQYWELASNPGVSVGTTNPLQVSSITSASYNAVATLAVGNLLDNGDFESGPSTGFISGGQYYTATTNLSGGGTNVYNVSTDTKNGNAAWLTLPPAPGSTGTKIFAADAKGPVGQKIIAWQFSATAGAQYFFSGWVSNNHIDFTNSNAATANSASIGVVITSGTPTYPGNPLLTSISLPRTNSWQKMTSTWTAPSTGTFTLYLVDLNGSSGGSNDFVLDDFVLAPSTGITKKANVVTPVCNPCLNDIPTVATATFCGNSGTVKLTPAATEAYPTTVQFDWYNQSTAGTKIGTTVGNNAATIDVSTVATNGAGNKIVYYQKSYKGSGKVFKQADACDPTFGGTSNTIDAGNVGQIEQRYTATKAITLTGMSYNVVTKPYQSNITIAGTVTYTVYGSKSYNGGLIADRTVVYGTFSQPYSRAVTTQSDLSQIVSVTGSVAVPAGDFFIVGSISGTSGNGAFLLGKSDCGQTVPKVDDLNGTTVSRSGSASYGNPDSGGSIKMGTSFNVTFALPAYVCPRTPVTLTPSCPCTKPSVVTITTPAAASVTICQGTAQTLSGTVTVTAAAQNTNFQYSWIKAGATPAADVVLQTATIALTANTATAVPNYTGITGAVADAGKYILRVEDGNAKNPSCFTDDTLTLVVNATTTPGVIAAAQTICTGGDPAAFTVTTAAAGGNGTTYTYQWEKSINGAAYTTIASATNATYDEGVLTNAGTTAMTVDYQRKVTSGACPQVTSNVIRITVNPAVVPGVVAADQTICSGGDPAAFTQTTAATGGSGTYTYQWQSATTNTPASFANIALATNATYDAPSGLTVTTYYRRIDGSGTCATAATNVITVTVQPTTTAGVIAASQTICTGGDPAAFTVTTAAGGGNGTFAYVWEKSINGGAYSVIVGATNATYDEGVLTNAGTTAMTFDYQRKVTSGTCPQVTSNVIRITVNPAVVPGVVAANQTICSGGDPAAFTQTTAATGGSGTYTYQWQSATINTPASFTNISAAATNATYDAPSGLTTTTYYRRVDASGTCATAATNVITVTVTPNVTPSVTIATPSTTICNGTSVTFTATPTNGGAAPTYQWFKGPVGSGASLGAASTNNTYTTTTAANGDSYYVVMTSNASCPSPATANSTAIVMTVTTVVTPAVSITVAPGTTICAGTSITFTASPGNGGSGPTYQWFKGPVGSGASLGAASTNNTYTTTTAANGDSYYVVMTSNSTCVVAPGTATSTAIVMTVNPIITPSVSIAVSPTGAICAGASLTFTATPTNGGTPTYQWYKGPSGSGTSLGASATNATYTTTTAANGDSYYVVMTSNATCVSPATATSSAIVATVNPILVPSVTLAASPATICTNGSTTFTATPVNPGGAPTYEWFINNISKAGPAASATFSTTLLTSSSDVVKVVMTSNALCASPTTASATKSVTVNTGIGAGTIGVDQTICYNTIPAALTETVAPTNIAGTPTYTWEASPTGLAGTFVTIPSAVSQGYVFPIALTQDVYIRRVITDPGTPAPCNVATSNTIHITVNPQLVAGVIAGNETTCANVSTATITSTSLPTGGTGSYTYQWKSSATAGGPYTSIASATNATYSPGILTSTTYFVRVETSGTCGNVTSNEITKTVNPVLVPSVTLAASPTTICTNGSTTFTATPVNPGGSPLYEWFIKTGSGSFVSQGAPASSATFSTTALVSSTDVVQVTMTSNALCASPATASATKSVIVNAGIGAGTIGTAQTICYNTLPAALTETVAPTNIAGTPTYTWEASLTGLAGSFTAVPGTGQGYTFPAALTQDIYIRRIITDPGTPAPCNVATSNTVRITVRPVLVAGVVGSDETICSGSVPALMTQTAAPTGGTGSYTYQWQSDASGIFNNIPGATNASYTSGALTATTKFQRIETSGTCGSVTSNVVTKTITTPETITLSLSDPGQVCSGSAPYTFTATASNGGGSGTLSYVWYLGPIGPGNIVGTNSSTYTYSPVIGDNGKAVSVVVSTSNGCNTGSKTQSVTLNIVNATTPTATITTPTNPNCAGLITTFTATSTGGGSGPLYQWYVVPAGSPAGTVGTAIAGATNITYSTSALTNGDRVYVSLTSNLTCLIGTNPFKSNEITMQIKAIPTPTITEGDQTICSPNSFTFHGNVTSGNTFEWRSLPNNTVVGTGIDLTTNQSGTYTLFEDNGTCNSTSAPVTLNVIQTPIANAGSDIFIKQGDAGNLNGSGGAVYSWSPATYLSNASVSNPSFTATQTITYTLTVSDATSTCSKTDDVTVYVVSPIKVPNVITINGDGTNDDWDIENIEGYPNVNIQIFNRWGNLVWKSDGYPKNWDGTNYRNGEVLSDGTYFYIIDLHNEVYPEPLTGWIQIIR